MQPFDNSPEEVLYAEMMTIFEEHMFDTYEEFQEMLLEVPDANGCSQEFLVHSKFTRSEALEDQFKYYLKMNASNSSCWNCYRCENCEGCIECSFCKECENCSECSSCEKCNDCKNCNQNCVYKNSNYHGQL